jgi:chaperonin GroES
MPTKTKAKVDFQPLSNRVVIKTTESEEQRSPGGIYIPDTAKERPKEGKVVAVGPGKLDENGKRIPMEVKVGDTVIFREYAGDKHREGEEEYLVIREDEILFKRA